MHCSSYASTSEQDDSESVVVLRGDNVAAATAGGRAVVVSGGAAARRNGGRLMLRRGDISDTKLHRVGWTATLRGEWSSGAAGAFVWPPATVEMLAELVEAADTEAAGGAINWLFAQHDPIPCGNGLRYVS